MKTENYDSGVALLKNPLLTEIFVGAGQEALVHAQFNRAMEINRVELKNQEMLAANKQTTMRNGHSD